MRAFPEDGEGRERLLPAPLTVVPLRHRDQSQPLHNQEPVTKESHMPKARCLFAWGGRRLTTMFGPSK